LSLALPIAAALGLAAGAAIFLYDLPLAVIAQRTVNSLDSTPLLAVPMFIFAACIFNTAGITQHLFDFIRMLVGRIRGGLGYVTILTHLVFSGISGAALADIGALGSIQIRMMRQQGYKDEFSAGICMAAATLGPIFPPSIPLVIYATTVEISAVRLMLAGIIPALVIAAVLMAQIAWIARRQGLPVDTVQVTRAAFLRQSLIAAPAILAPVILIAGMMSGVFGATEPAGITVAYAILVGALVYRKLTLASFIESARETVLACASILLIVGVSELFAWVLAIDQVPTLAAQFLISLSANPYVLLIIANFVLLAAGTILEPLPAIPLSAPLTLCNPGRELRKHRQGDLGILVEELLEVAPRDREALHRGLGSDPGVPRLIGEEGQLTEELPRPQVPGSAVRGLNLDGSLLQHEHP